MSKSKDVKHLAPFIDGDLYQLEGGDYIRIYSLCEEEDECNYGYDYFDGRTKMLRDGGIFHSDGVNSEEILREVMYTCDVEEESFSLIGENMEYDDLAEEGFGGF